MVEICRRRWLDRQGIRQLGLQPCGQCAACLADLSSAAAPVTSRKGCRCERKHPELAWLRDVAIDASGVAVVAGAVKDAIADDDTGTADRLLVHAVHLGLQASDLFTAGGKRRRKTTGPPQGPEPELGAPDLEPPPDEVT